MTSSHCASVVSRQSRCRRDRRVVDHDIEAAVACHGGADQAINLIPLPHVDALEKTLAPAAQDQIESGLAAFEGRAHEIRKDYPGAFPCECQGDRAADSRAAPVTTATFPASNLNMPHSDDISCEPRHRSPDHRVDSLEGTFQRRARRSRSGQTLFGQLERATRRGRGIVRDSYGAGEQAAHDIVRAAAEQIGLEVSIDAIGNLAMTLPGKDRRAPRILIGSHLDSVPQGGNFDGAAGVVAGLCALAALRQSGFVPPCDIGVMAIRAEESSWFDVSYLGSAGAFGLLDPACLSVRRSDNGRTLEETLLERGFDPTAIRQRRRLLEPEQVRAYLELHIEQGPRLVAEGLPAAVVTGIRGCRRFRNARCVGRIRALRRATPRAQT